MDPASAELLGGLAVGAAGHFGGVRQNAEMRKKGGGR